MELRQQQRRTPHQEEQVVRTVQPRPSAVNMALPATAAQRRAAAPLLEWRYRLIAGVSVLSSNRCC